MHLHESQTKRSIFYENNVFLPRQETRQETNVSEAFSSMPHATGYFEQTAPIG